MRIVQLVTHMDTIGGAQIHVKDIAVELKNSGHDIFLVAGGKEIVHESLEKNKIKLVHSKHLIRNLNVLSDIKAVLEIRKILKEIRPDLIATHSSKAGTVGRIAGWSLRIPTIFTAHGWSFTDGISERKKKIYILIERLIGLISDGVIAVSEYDKRLALTHKVLPEDKVYTIHNGVHEVELLENPICPNKIPNIIMVARFAPPKRQLQLVKALYEIRHLHWKVFFAGDGPLIQEVKDYVEKVGFGDRVIFLGYRQDITKLLQRSDLCVLLSDWEGLPLSILEAMRCGLPIISSDVGGVKEAVIQSKNGFLIPKDDNNELVNKLAFMLASPSLRLEMGESSRQLYEEYFTFERMYKETISYYEKIVQTKQVVEIQTTY